MAGAEQVQQQPTVARTVLMTTAEEVLAATKPSRLAFKSWDVQGKEVTLIGKVSRRGTREIKATLEAFSAAILQSPDVMLERMATAASDEQIVEFLIPILGKTSG